MSAVIVTTDDTGRVKLVYGVFRSIADAQQFADDNGLDTEDDPDVTVISVTEVTP